MIAKFKDVEVKRTNNNMNIYVDVEFLNQPEDMINPSIMLSFQNGNFKGSKLLEQDSASTNYNIDEVETFQALHYVGNLPNERLEEILFTA